MRLPARRLFILYDAGQAEVAIAMNRKKVTKPLYISINIIAREKNSAYKINSLVQILCLSQLPDFSRVLLGS